LKESKLKESYVIKGNLTEAQIEADVAQYLGWCSVDLPFRLHDVDEQLTGADKMSDVAVPIYIQFKKSTGLRPLATHPIKPRKNESPLQSIRRFREHHQLPDDPTLFFELRRRAENAIDLQHNILLAHHLPPFSYAIYVAPLHLNRKDYFEELFRAPRYLETPWDMRYANLRSGWKLASWLSRFDRQPFLRNHVSIPPHQKVDHHNHHYAYSTAGCSVTWHSGEIVESRTSRLSDFLSRRTRELLSLDYELPSPEQGLIAARRSLNSLNIFEEEILKGGEPLEQLLRYGQWLWNGHGIRQILMLGNREQLQATRSLQE